MIKARPILPGAMLGVLGGGQLGRMFVLRAREMGYRTAAYDPDPQAPALAAADEAFCAAFDDHAALERFAMSCDAVTLEFENIPADSIRYVEAHALTAPSARAVELTQDRWTEKSLLRELGLATAAFAQVLSRDDVDAALEATGLPAILKTSRFGYDGKGQARIFSADDARAAFVEFGSVPCILEARIPLRLELSCVIARGADGDTKPFAPGENVHRHGILHTTVVPSEAIPNDIAELAEAIARRIADALDYVGVMGVEFFLSQSGELLVNEIAPRPHNSGHWTQDASEVCQFEQQLRALCGLPLGANGYHSPVCMINILGDVWPADGGQPDWVAALAVPGVRLHLYGKAEPRRGRKMGHLNVLGEGPEDSLRRAEEAWRALHGPFGPPRESGLP